MNGHIDEGAADYDHALASSYEKLLGTKLTPESRERLWRFKDALALKDDDPMWNLFFVLDHYETLFETIPTRIEDKGNEVVAKLQSISSATSTKAIEDARKLTAEERTSRARFLVNQRQARQRQNRDEVATFNKFAAVVVEDAAKTAKEEVTKVVLSAIRGELQQLREEAASQAVTTALANRASWFETLVFFVYAVAAAGYDVWSWIATPRVGLTVVVISIVVGAFIASITIAKPAFVKIGIR